jgi:PAS domain S-box-containing protein
MQSVKERWYNLYAWIITAIAAGLLVGSILSLFVPAYEYFQGYGLTYLTLGLAGTIVAFRLLAFQSIAKNYGLRSAAFMISLLAMLESTNLTNSTGQFHSWYYAGWLLLVAFSGIFGGYIVISLALLTTMYLILITTNTPGIIHIDTFSLLAVVLTYLICGVSYLIWRNFYIDQESLQVAKLSGALKNTEKQSATLIESLADGVIVTDTEGKVNLINPAAASLIGWPVDEARGLDVHSVIKLVKEDGKDLGTGEDPFTVVVNQKQSFNRIMGLVDRSNKNHVVSLVISPVLSKNNELAGTVAVIRDVSEERKEEQQRADFISTASHEMRTPVAAIEGYLALALNEQVSKIDSKAREYLEKAHSSTQHLGKLFQDLLTSAKAEDGRLVSHPVVVEMGTYLEQLAESLRFAAEKKGLFVEFIFGTNQSNSNAVTGAKVIKPFYYVHVDPDRLREVITNLFDNAVKFTDTGKVTLGLTGDEKVVQLYVKDTGPGIPAEDIPHLFQKFYRVDSSATRTIGGTGLGLFICRKIVELYNGRIWVESEEGNGSTFFINLPRLSGQQASQFQSQEAAQTSPL